jgi:hypothetical protein
MALPSRIGFPAFDRPFDVEPPEAHDVWEAGDPNWDDFGDHGNDSEERLSGSWRIRRSGLVSFPSASQRIEVIKAEINSLRGVGVLVVSHALAATPEGWGTYGLGPVLRTERPCPEDLYEEKVLPGLQKYFQAKLDQDQELQASDPELGAAATVNFFSELDNRSNFSVLEGRPQEPFWDNLAFKVENTNTPRGRDLFYRILEAL